MSDHCQDPKKKRKPPPVLSASWKQSNLVGNIWFDIIKGNKCSNGVPIHEVLREAEAKLFELRASEHAIKLRRVAAMRAEAAAAYDAQEPGREQEVVHACMRATSSRAAGLDLASASRAEVAAEEEDMPSAYDIRAAAGGARGSNDSSTVAH